MNRRRLYEAKDPVEKIQALIDAANQAYQSTVEVQGETEWPLMDKDGETYGLKGQIKLDKRGYLSIPIDGGTYGSYGPVKFKVLQKAGGKVRIFPGDYWTEGWNDAQKILKQIIRDAQIGNGHFHEYDPNWEDNGDVESLKAMNKKIGRKANAGRDNFNTESVIRRVVRESINRVLNEVSMNNEFEDDDYNPWTTGDASWINGTYEFDGCRVEINTGLSSVSIDYDNGEEYYLQGDEADELIKEICRYWNRNEQLTQDDAVKDIISSQF